MGPLFRSAWLLAAWVLVPCGHAQDSRPDTQPATRPAPDTVRGTLTWIDPSGKRNDKPNGKLTLIVWMPAAPPLGEVGDHIEVAVTAGQWTLVCADHSVDPRATAVGASSFAMGDQRAYFPEARHPLDQPLLLEARAAPTLRLLVHDAATRDPLANVDVAAGGGWQRDLFLHPGEDFEARLVVRRGQPPVAVPAPALATSKRTLWVRAPGHAWQRVEVVPSAGGDLPVALERGGELAVSVRGEFPASTCVLRLYQDRRAVPVAEFQLHVGRQTVVRDLAAGSYSARLEQGDWFRQPAVLAQEAIEVVAGRETMLALTANATAAIPPKVNLMTTVLLPKDWLATPRLSLSIDAIGAVRAWATDGRHIDFAEWGKGDQPGEYRVPCKDLYAGSYELRVEPLEVRVRVDLAAGAPASARIEVPLPQTVRVRVVDEVTGKVIPDATVSWHGALPPGVTGWGGQSHAAEPGSEAVRLTVPRGEVYVSVAAEGYEGFDEQQCLVEAEPLAVTLKLRRQCGVHVLLADGAAQVPLIGHDQIQLEPLAGQAPPSSFSSGKVFVRQGGRYQLQVATPDGYEAIPDREVTVRDGEVLRVEIALKRQK